MKRIVNSNESYSDGWVRLMTPGEYPHPSGYLQKVTPDILAALVAESKSLKSRIKKWISGWPVFKGHPDVHPSVYRDNSEYGTIIDLMSNEQGLFCRLALNKSGESLVNNGIKYLSAVWFGTLEGGYFIPKRLLSVGLTPSPVIKTGEALANSREVFLESYYFRPRTTINELLQDAENLKKKEAIITKLLREE